MEGNAAMPKGAVIRKVPRGDRRRVELIDVAEKMFLQRGFAETTMQMIAEAAGASKETFYRHFENKEQLFAEIISRKARQISGPDAPMARGGSAETVLTELGTNLPRAHRRAVDAISRRGFRKAGASLRRSKACGAALSRRGGFAISFAPSF
jgi:AcrR family transcriptional regulator